MALIGVARSDDSQPHEPERIDLLLLHDAQLGLADVEAGRTRTADAAIAQIQQRRTALNVDNTAKKQDR